jgi:hypothetical protein
MRTDIILILSEFVFIYSLKTKIPKMDPKISELVIKSFYFSETYYSAIKKLILLSLFTSEKINLSKINFSL